MKLAREIVSIFHGDAAAEAAESHFRTVFQKRELPPDMPAFTVSGPVNVVELLTQSGLAKSKSAARRLIQQGGVRLDGERVPDISTVIEVTDEAVLQVGRRRFIRLVAG